MRALDPEEDDPSPAGPQDTQSSDQSKSKLRSAWDAWTSRPENNAALLQTGLALLQPRAPGQSAVGNFANAVGQGAEASQRNVAQQEATAKEEAAQEIKSREAASREMTAGAYAEQVKQGGSKKAPGVQAKILAQRSFNDWAKKAEDTTGLTADPIVGALSKEFPDVKTKADVLRNPRAVAAARRLFAEQLAEPDDEGNDNGSVPAPSSPSTPGPRIIYKGNVPYQWDGIPGHPPVPMGQ